MGETGDTALKRENTTQGFGNFLQGGGAGDSIVWVGYVGPFGENGEEGRRDTHRISLSYHVEESEGNRRQDIGDAWGGRRTGCSRNTVGGDLPRYKGGNLGSVVGATSLI